MKSFIESNIPSFVERVNGNDSWLKFAEKADKHGLPKVLVFSKSRTTTPLLKYASTEFRRRLLISEVKKTKANAGVFSEFGISDPPALVVIPPNAQGSQETQEPLRYEKKGFSFHKVINFLSKHALKEKVARKKKTKNVDDSEEKTEKTDM